MSEIFRQNMPFFKYLSKNFVNRISLFIIFRVHIQKRRFSYTELAVETLSQAVTQKDISRPSDM